MDTLTIEAVAHVARISISTLRRMIDPTSKYFDPEFPKPKQVGSRRKLWIRSDVENWLTSSQQ